MYASSLAFCRLLFISAMEELSAVIYASALVFRECWFNVELTVRKRVCTFS